jgi:hypothetical protein
VRIVWLFGSFLVLITVSAPARGGMITNGSFEDPVVAAGGYTNYLAGSTDITGWTVVGVDSAVTSGTFMQSGITFEAEDGKQWIDLAGVTSNSDSSGVTQEVSTNVGQKYQLSFYVGATTDHNFFYPSTVDLSIDGGTRTSYTNDVTPVPTTSLDWKQFTVDFTAKGATTKITFYNGSASNNYVTALDNVSLTSDDTTAVPEPAGITLVSIGACALLLAIARSRRRPVLA